MRPTFQVFLMKPTPTRSSIRGAPENGPPVLGLVLQNGRSKRQQVFLRIQATQKFLLRDLSPERNSKVRKSETMEPPGPSKPPTIPDLRLNLRVELDAAGRRFDWETWVSIISLQDTPRPKRPEKHAPLSCFTRERDHPRHNSTKRGRSFVWRKEVEANHPINLLSEGSRLLQIAAPAF